MRYHAGVVNVGIVLDSRVVEWRWGRLGAAILFIHTGAVIHIHDTFANHIFFV